MIKYSLTHENFSFKKVVLYFVPPLFVRPMKQKIQTTYFCIHLQQKDRDVTIGKLSKSTQLRMEL